MKKLTIILSAFLCLCTFFSCSEKDDEIIGGKKKTKHEAVDLGLPSGLLWATCNVGANAPEEYGDYFAWGETKPKNSYDSETYKFGDWGSLAKYCTDSDYGTIDNKATLDSKDDAAHVNWGGAWRMPTKSELQELRDRCNWTWTILNGVNGYKVTGSNGNSIFLPAAGCQERTSSSLLGTHGRYWSSTLYPDFDIDAYNLEFGSNNASWGGNDRYVGFSVRAVRL